MITSLLLSLLDMRYPTLTLQNDLLRKCKAMSKDCIKTSQLHIYSLPAFAQIWSPKWPFNVFYSPVSNSKSIACDGILCIIILHSIAISARTCQRCLFPASITVQCQLHAQIIVHILILIHVWPYSFSTFRSSLYIQFTITNEVLHVQLCNSVLKALEKNFFDHLYLVIFCSMPIIMPSSF